MSWDIKTSWFQNNQNCNYKLLKAFLHVTISISLWVITYEFIKRPKSRVPPQNWQFSAFSRTSKNILLWEVSGTPGQHRTEGYLLIKDIKIFHLVLPSWTMSNNMFSHIQLRKSWVSLIIDEFQKLSFLSRMKGSD